MVALLLMQSPRVSLAELPWLSLSCPQWLTCVVSNQSIKTVLTNLPQTASEPW